MFRRNPTRIELKLDDLHEWDTAKKDMEEKHLKDPVAMAISSAESTCSTSAAKAKPSTQDRIGFVPTNQRPPIPKRSAD